MMNKDSFAKWLETYANIKPYSIGRYSNAIDTISSELGDYGLQKVNLFNLNNTAFIDTILSNPKFKMKDKKGHRMYSVSLNHFKKYIMSYYDSEFQAELLKEEQEFEKYLTEKIVDAGRDSIKDKPKDKPAHRLVNNRKLWSRNPKFAIDAVAYANYCCEFNHEHQHFISKFTNENYVEAHHLIPMKYQENFNCSLDVHANIVSLCLVCHRKLHFGLFEEKKELLDKLFTSRKERLKASGIDIGVNDLYRYYTD